MPAIAFEGNGNFPLESKWDGNTMTSIKVVFDAADKLRCETVK